MLVGYMLITSDSTGPNATQQREALMEAGVDRWRIFEDHPYGPKDVRPALDEALAALRPGDTLVVWKLDRLGRSLSHLLSILNSLKERRIAFRSLTEGIDTATQDGEMFLHLLGSLQWTRFMRQAHKP